MTARAQWATDRLSAWLREESQGVTLDLLTQLREAVEHFADCPGQDRTCAGLSDECEDTDPQDCKYCATPCEECQWLRDGRDGLYAIRPVWDLLAELEYLLGRQDGAVA